MIATDLHKNKSLFLFAVDHKIEHLNDDFKDTDHTVRDIFTIAQQGECDALMTHLGLIEQYGPEFPYLQYVVKLNGKTNLIPQNQKDPISTALWTIDQVIQFQERTKITISGVAYTIYLGSEYEHIMMQEAAQIIFKAHQQNLPVFIFAYPRGKSVTQPQNHPDLVTGAAGVAASLGADFVKLAIPYKNGEIDTETIRRTILAAGKTKVLFAGGSSLKQKDFLQKVSSVCKLNSNIGFAIGRNIFQSQKTEAIIFSKQIKRILQS